MYEGLNWKKKNPTSK